MGRFYDVTLCVVVGVPRASFVTGRVTRPRAAESAAMAGAGAGMMRIREVNVHAAGYESCYTNTDPNRFVPATVGGLMAFLQEHNMIAPGTVFRFAHSDGEPLAGAADIRHYSPHTPLPPDFLHEGQWVDVHLWAEGEISDGLATCLVEEHVSDGDSSMSGGDDGLDPEERERFGPPGGMGGRVRWQQSRGALSANPWIRHVQRFRAFNPHVSYKDALQLAAPSYRRRT